MKNVTIKLLALSLGLLISSSLRAQEVAITKTITLEGAKVVLAEAQKYAKEHNSPGGSIAVVDASGYLLVLERITNTFPASALVAYEKANTAATFKAPSKKLEDAINGGRDALITVGHTFLKGGVPIIIDGQVIGAVGVSGAASADQDEEIAQAGAAAKIGM